MYAIYCSGSLGNEIASMIRKETSEELLFIDDVREDNTCCGISVICWNEFIKQYDQQTEVIIATGEPFFRHTLREKVKKYGYNIGGFISERAYVSNNTDIRDGCVIFPNTYIAGGTKCGENTIIHAGAQIEARSVGDDCFISLGAFIGDYTEVKNEVFIGPQAVIRDNLTLGKCSIVGMNSVVLSDVEPESVVVGNPAREIRKNATHLVWNNK